VQRQPHRRSRRLKLFAWIEGWYKPERIITALGMRSPNEYEAAFYLETPNTNAHTPSCRSGQKPVARIELSRRPRRARLPSFVAETEVGLGEVIKRATSLAGIRSCGSCLERRVLGGPVVSMRMICRATKETGNEHTRFYCRSFAFQAK
jgi:hypothetical protein